MSFQGKTNCKRERYLDRGNFQASNALVNMNPAHARIVYKDPSPGVLE